MHCPHTHKLPCIEVAGTTTMLVKESSVSGVKVHTHDVPGRSIG